MDRNHCPQSIGIPVRNRRNPQSKLASARNEEEYILQALPAWAILQTTSFGPLTHLFALLREEVGNEIAKHFDLARDVVKSLLYGLKDLRNACAHHEPIWNWDANYRGSRRIMRFPRRYVQPAGLTDEGRIKLYAYCTTIHILLSYLSAGRSTWYRRLKKLVNEFNTTYTSAMGFPDTWQTLPFWCVSDVRQTDQALILRERVSAYRPYKN